MRENILSRLKKKTTSKVFRNQWLYVLVIIIEFLGIHFSSDLATELGNWSVKAGQILHGHIPTDNFYGPGSSIMLIPFLWNGPTYF